MQKWLLSFIAIFMIFATATVYGYGLPLITPPAIEYNSQTVTLLTPVVNNNNGALGGGDIKIADDVALVADANLVGGSSAIEVVPNNGKISVYTVHDGDTLSQIADMYGVSVNTIRWANDLKGSIQPGQTLVILPVTGITHVVKSGGTIKDIANIYDADIQEIALFNGVGVHEHLEAGHEIIVPNVDGQNSSGGSTQYASSGSASAGYYSNPVPGAILTQNIHGYNAVDIGAAKGTPIYASAAGTVIKSKSGGWNGGYGVYVVISHANGTQTLYAHNSSNVVSVGQKVSAGELIAYMGSTGNSTGSHVHFEVRGGTNPAASCQTQAVCR